MASDGTLWNIDCPLEILQSAAPINGDTFSSLTSPTDSAEETTAAPASYYPTRQLLSMPHTSHAGVCLTEAQVLLANPPFNVTLAFSAKSSSRINPTREDALMSSSM
jgi:hypothetical protein